MIAAALIASNALAAGNDVTPLHDPCLIRQGDTYYVFCTGPRAPIRTSRDLIHWTRAGDVFSALPAWATQAVPGARGTWAPDVTFTHGQYRLYYTVSTFGSRRSAIGLATNATLDPTDPAYEWVDQGPVLATQKDSDWNAIDPAAFDDGDGGAWLAAGSFWGGLKLSKLDPATGRVVAGDVPRPIAARPHDGGAIEAPFLFRRGEWVYLWASFDFCCKGVRSSYNVRVGRSRKVDGPYFDRDGRPMLDGGGTLVLAGSGDVRGPGHCAVYHDGERDLLVHHFYDAAHDGRPTLQVRPLTWDATDWPVAGTPIAGPTTRPATQASP